MTDITSSTNSRTEIATSNTSLEHEVLQRLKDLETQVRETKPASPDRYKRILDTIQAVIIVAGFGFTVSQVWKLQEATDLSAWNSVSTEWLKVDQYFVKNPELTKYFYDGVLAAPTDENYEKVQATAIYVLNFLDYAISTSDHIVRKYPEAASFIKPEVWKAYVQSTYFKSPAVCELLKKLSAGYAPETRRLGLATCKNANL